MPLNDLTSEYSINTISQKTNISVEVLEKLLNKEWESLQRAKVDGFLRIIERDFNIDLSDIKQEAKEFYDTHKKESPNRPIDLVDAQTIGGGSGRFFANVLTVLAIALVAYAIWFYFFSFNKPDNSSNSSSSSSGLFNDSINSAKSLIGAVEHNKTKKNQENKNNKTIVDINSSNTLNSIKSSSKSKEKIEENKTINKFDIVSIKKEEENRTKLSDNSSNISSVNKESKQIETSATVDSLVNNSSNNTVVTNPIKNEVESLLEENKSSLSNNSDIDINSSAITEANVSSDLNNSTIVNSDNNQTLEPTIDKIGEFTIKNRAKSIWIGLYNLDTKKRVVKVLAKTPYSYKLDGKRVAIVTGHNKFTIETDSGISKSFTKKGRVYLLITENEIKYITKNEYKKVTNNKAW